MPSANNNTDSLSEQSTGTIGTRNFSDYNAREISTAISRSNYRKAIISDSRMQEFREAVYRMVSGWLREDKIAIITEYGDGGMLSRNPNNEEINRICTESLIIHLRPEDLQTLYNDIAKREKRLLQNVKNINGSRESAGIRAMAAADKARALNMRTFKDAAKSVSDADEKTYQEKRKAFDPNYGVPKNITSKYRELRSELNDVLTNCFNKIQINEMLQRMEIEFDESASFKDLKKAIINRTVLYVDLVVGRNSKGNNFGSGLIMDPEPYNDLLKYTSYSFITGEPGLDPSEWARIKKQAREAKEAMRERARMQNNKAKFKSKEVQALTGGIKARKLSDLSKKLRNNDPGILKEASYDQLVELAGKYGIDPTAKRNKDIATLKAKIYNAMGNEARRIQQLTRQQTKLAGKGRHSRLIDDQLAAHSNYSNDRILNPDDNGESKNVPIIHLNNRGFAVERKILTAVPVAIVASFLGGNREKSIMDSDSVASHNRTLEEFLRTDLGLPPGDPHRSAAFPSMTKLFNMHTSYGGTAQNKQFNKDHGYEKVDFSELDEEELYIYNLTYSLPDGGNIYFDGTRTPRSIEEFLAMLMLPPYDARDTIVTEILGIPDRDLKRLAAAWLWAGLTGHKKLYSYLGSTYKFTWKKLKMKRRKAARVASTIFSFGIVGVIRGIKNAKKAIKRRFSGDEESLSDQSKAVLREVRQAIADYTRDEGNDELNYTYTLFVKSMTAKGYDFVESFRNRFLHDVPGRSERIVKLLFTALLAFDRGDNTVKNFLLRQAIAKAEEPPALTDPWDARGIKNFLKSLCRRGNIFSKIARSMKRGATSVKNLFSKRNYNTNGQITPASKSQEEIDDNSNVLAGIKWDDNTHTLKEHIKKVLPVYVVNPWNNIGWMNLAPSYSVSTSSASSITSSIISGGTTTAGPSGGSFIGGDDNNLTASSKDGMRLVGLGRRTSMKSSFKGADDFFKSLDEHNSFVADMSKPSQAFQSEAAKEGSKSTGGESDSPKAFRVMDVSGIMSAKLAIKKKSGIKNSALSDDARKIGIQTIEAIPAKPVYIANNLTRLMKAISGVGGLIYSGLSDIKLGMGSMVLSAPMGVGVMSSPYLMGKGMSDTILNTISKVSENVLIEMTDSFRSYTGSHITGLPPRFATGGNTVAITGDAAGTNIFAHGAKPELVRSTGDMDIVPLNKTGTEQRQKIDRMTQSERKSALATAISSHAIKYNYKLPDGAEDISNQGEAIKVFNVKPGLTDIINIQGADTTIADLLANIYATLINIVSGSSTSNQLLTTIAANTVPRNTGNASNTNPFAGGFPTSIDPILGGE